MKKTAILSSILILGIICGILFIFSSDNLRDRISGSDYSYRETSRHFYKIFDPPLPEEISFAGEKVPLDVFYVRESLEREILVNTYWHSNTLLMFKRAGRWFPVIDSILKREKVPLDFHYLALIESGLEQTVSPAGATGFWQIMKSTGTSYGLETNTEIDERYHVEKSTVAACKYLKQAYTKFKNWTLAAASYNMGMEGLSEQMKAQSATSYYDLYLNRETIRYVYRILAVKAIFTAPTEYGFYLRKSDLYPPVPTYFVTVDSAVADWPRFAASHKTNYRMLRELNPWILKTSLTNKDKKHYEVKLPYTDSISYDAILKQGVINDPVIFGDTIRIENIRLR